MNRLILHSGTILILIVAYLGLLTGAELRAESSQSSQGVDVGAAKISPGTVSTPAPPPPSDRSSKSSAAAAAARAGAGMQRVMCMKMMKDAQHESDPTNKALMQMMASQACQQASQTEQNADKNDDQSKLLSADETPKQSQLTAGNFQLKPSTGKEPSLPMGNSSPSDSSDSQADSGPLASPINPDNYTLMKPTSAPTDQPVPVAVATDEPTSALKPIKPGTTSYDENAAKQSASSANNYGGGVGGSIFNNSQTLAQNEKSGKAAGQDAPGTGPGKARRQIDSTESGPSSGGAGGGPSGSPEGEKSGGNEAFDALLAQMMGGGAPANGDFQTAGQDIIVLPGKQDSKLPNIFEFASWRYQKATFEEGRIHPHAPKSPKFPEAAKVARVSKH